MNGFYGIGNLTKAVISSTTESGEEVAKFTIAITRSKSPNGETIADYIPIRTKNRIAAACREYLKKGRKVSVEGELHTYNYVDKEGKRQYGFEVLAKKVEFLPSSNPNKTNLGDVHSDIHGPAHFDVGQKAGGFTEVDEEELPF